MQNHKTFYQTPQVENRFNIKSNSNINVGGFLQTDLSNLRLEKYGSGFEPNQIYTDIGSKDYDSICNQSEESIEEFRVTDSFYSIDKHCPQHTEMKMSSFIG